MARMRSTAERVERLLGTAVVATTAVAGGDICTATRVRLADGSSALVKTRPHPPEGFFAAEARGLRWLGEAAPAAEVLAFEDDCLVVGWIEPGRPTTEAAATFGRALAGLHAAGADCFGAADDGFIGLLPMPNGPGPDWPEFYATRRVLPYLRLASDRGHVEPDDRRAVEDVVRHIADLAGPDEPPARLHGDLWSGNVVWSGDHRGVLIDPAAHGGHRESDLAMLALFGLPHLQRVLDAYHEASPLADGWQDRQPLHQLFPLLVHAAMFGGRYGRLAGDAARRLR
ncbi:MAG TPA: fructosamine kinase family protein [Marmoricola sp.]|nr:fructosamine kinase family protein [Marmoricola sp.]